MDKNDIPKEAREFRDFEPLHAIPQYERMFVQNIAIEVANIAFPKERGASAQRTLEGLKNLMRQGERRNKLDIEKKPGDDNPAKEFRDELVALGSAKAIEQYCLKNKIYFPDPDRIKQIEAETAYTYDTITGADSHTDEQLNNQKGH